MPLKPLYNTDIDKTLKHISYYYKCIPKDFLNDIKVNPKSSFCCVLNLQNSNERGSHWVCLFVDKTKHFIEYFDSFGIPPIKNVVSFCKRNYPNRELFYQDNQLQMFSSVLCGYFCIYYIQNRFEGKSPYETLYSLKQEPSLSNELLIVE